MSEEENIPQQNSIEENVNENISPEQSIDQSQTENMEVHHHPDLHHKRKNFREYFLEFLMIFLAVTMGFFAESLREYLNEKHVTHENMQSMADDLRSDSSMFKTIFTANEYSVRMIDTLIEMLNNKSNNTGHLYFLARNITAVADEPRPDTRTFEQMRAEGSFRLLGNNKNILNEITFYYQSLKWFDVGNNLIAQRMSDVIVSNSALFKGIILKKIFSSEFVNAEHNTYKVLEPDGNPPLQTNDASVINTSIVRFNYFQSVLKENNGTIALEIERCNQLIKRLNKEYGLK